MQNNKKPSSSVKALTELSKFYNMVDSLEKLGNPLRYEDDNIEFLLNHPQTELKCE